MTTDEAYGISLAQTIVNHFHIIWAGENASNTGFYMGPFWAYFTAFWLFILKGNLIYLSYIGGTIGVITTVFVFITGKKLFNLKVAVIVGLLYASLPLIVFFDHRYWIVSPVPLLSVLIVLSLYQVRTAPKWLIVTAIAYGLVFHTHLSLAPLGLPIAYFIYLDRKALLKAKRTLLLSLLTFLIVISPLIVFDYYHKGSNLLTPFRIKNSVDKKHDNIDPTEHLDDIFRTLSRLWYLSPDRVVADEVLYACSPFYAPQRAHTPGLTTSRSLPITGISFFSAIILGCFLIRRRTWKDRNTKAIGLSLVTIYTAYLLFPMVPLDYYLLGSFPLFLFVPAVLATVSSPPLRKGFWTIIIIFITLGIYTVISDSGSYGLQTKINLVKKVSALIGSDKFEIREEGNCQTNGGWRQVFKRFGKSPGRAPADLSVGYLYPEEIDKGKLRYRVVIFETRITPNNRKLDANVVEDGGFWAEVGKNW